jgi:hypothetical protein
MDWYRSGHRIPDQPHDLAIVFEWEPGLDICYNDKVVTLGCMQIFCYGKYIRLECFVCRYVKINKRKPVKLS